MQRPAIPSEIRRAVLVEAGHRCAISTCKYPSADVHHIIPWEKSQDHDFDNLIALCPNCHRRADSSEIDRKALRMYKAQLIASMGRHENFDAYETSILEESINGKPGYEFQFKIPVFGEKDLKFVQQYFEVMGNELLQEHRNEHYLQEALDIEYALGPHLTTGSYEIIWLTESLVSLKYRVYRYGSGAAHGNGQTITKTFLRNPLQILKLDNLFTASGYMQQISNLCREALLKDGTRDEVWVHEGTQPLENNFSSFNVIPKGLLLTFDEYRVDCYAAGPQIVEIEFTRFQTMLNPRLERLWL